MGLGTEGAENIQPLEAQALPVQGPAAAPTQEELAAEAVDYSVLTVPPVNPSKVSAAELRDGELSDQAVALRGDIKMRTNEIAGHIGQARDILRLAEPLDSITPSTPPLEVYKQLHGYRLIENQLSRIIQELGAEIGELQEKPVVDAIRAFKHRTGWLDNPLVNGTIAAGAAGVSLAAGIGGIVYYHSALSRLSHAIVAPIADAMGLVHGGLAAFALTTTSHLTVLVAAGIAAMSLSYYGALLWGVAKYAGSKLITEFSQRRRKEVTAARLNARAVQQALAGSLNENIEDLLALVTTVKSFRDLCVGGRDAVTELRSKVAGQEITSDGLAVKDLKLLGWELGTDAEKFVTLILVQARRLVELQNVDIRLPGYHETSAGSRLPKWVHRVVTPTLRLLSHAKAAGPLAASQRVLELKELCHRAHGSIAVGAAEGLLSVLDMAIQTGQRPDAGVTDTLKGFLGLLNMGKDMAEGPTLEQLLKMVLETDEKDTRKRAGKLMPNLALFIFKKVYFIMRSEREALASGDLRPGGLEKEHAKHEGVIREWRLAARKIGGLALQATFGAAAKNFIEMPLRFAARIEPQIPILKRLRPAERGAIAWFTLRKELVLHNRLPGRGLAKIEQSLPQGRELAAMPMSEVKRHALERLLHYSRDEAIDPKELDDLFAYWQKRELYEWLEEQKHEVLHQAEIVRYGSPQLLRLTNAIRSYQPTKQGNPATPQLIDVTADGAIVGRDAAGILLMIHDHEEATQFIAGNLKKTKPGAPEPALFIPFHANNARKAAAELYLGIHLDALETKVLMEVHHAKDLPLPDAAGRLMAAGFKPHQLFRGLASNDPAPGLLETGLIGGRVPSEQEIEEAKLAVA